MVISIINKHNNYSVNYTLTTKEYKKFIDILFLDSSTGYSAFLITFLKEVNGDINKILRILSTGVKSPKKIFPPALPNYLIIAIKEAIVLSNYKEFIEEDGFISIASIAKLQRFKVANIDRQTIIRTFKKYNIKYNSRK
jgi:hypothetical protein